MMEALVYGKVPTTPLVVEEASKKIDKILVILRESQGQVNTVSTLLLPVQTYCSAKYGYFFSICNS
jgi:hypothetical protein